jgi:hypothetical protein
MKRKTGCLFLLISVLSVFPALQGCSFFLPFREVVIQLPELPRDWEARFPGLEFRILCPDTADPDLFSVFPVPAGERSAAVRIPKAAYVPCLVRPVSDAGMLKPAGAVITETPGTAVYTAAWEDGFTAEILLKLWYREDIYPAVNGERLRTAITEKGEGNVWDLDPAPILLGFSFGSFRSDKIRLLPAYTIEVPLPGGRWFWDNPFRASVFSAGEHAPAVVCLPRGRHHLYHTQSEEHVLIHIGEKEWYAVYSLKEMCISGNW